MLLRQNALVSIFFKTALFFQEENRSSFETETERQASQQESASHYMESSSWKSEASF